MLKQALPAEDARSTPLVAVASVNYAFNNVVDSQDDHPRHVHGTDENRRVCRASRVRSESQVKRCIGAAIMLYSLCIAYGDYALAACHPLHVRR